MGEIEPLRSISTEEYATAIDKKCRQPAIFIPHLDAAEAIQVRD
jgi:hypothetical protein